MDAKRNMRGEPASRHTFCTNQELKVR